MSSDVTDVWQYDCDITLNPDPSFEKKVKRNLGPNFVSLTIVRVGMQEQ